MAGPCYRNRFTASFGFGKLLSHERGKTTVNTDGQYGAALFMLIILGLVIIFYVVIPVFYQRWKKSHPHSS